MNLTEEIDEIILDYNSLDEDSTELVHIMHLRDRLCAQLSFISKEVGRRRKVYKLARFKYDKKVALEVAQLALGHTVAYSEATAKANNILLKGKYIDLEIEYQCLKIEIDEAHGVDNTMMQRISLLKKEL